MLKISDYIAIVLSFVAMLALYLVVAHNFSISLVLNDLLNPLSVPDSYDLQAEWVSDEPEFAIITGDQGGSDESQEMTLMVSNLKKKHNVFATVDDITPDQEQFVRTIIVTADSWDQVGNANKLFEYAENGVTVIFSHLMQGQNAAELNKTLGVLDIGTNTEIDGILLSDKLMVQKSTSFDDLTCSVNDVTIDSRCSKLMVEWDEDDKDKEDPIPLVWEKRQGSGVFYVVNGNFLSEEYGMGILTGLLSCASDVFVYPVVNAKVNIFDFFPQLDNPYEDRIQELYSRDTNMFLRDIVWPYVVKLCEVDGLVPTALVEEPPSAETQEKFQALVDLMERRGCEVIVAHDDPDYKVPYTIEGFTRSADKAFATQCDASGMALATHYLDMSEIMGKNADDPEYEWNSYSLELSELMGQINQDIEWVDAVTLSTAEERYKRYVMLRPEYEQTDEGITIKTSHFDEMCFYLVRTDKPLYASSNCEVTKVGDAAYLVKVTGEEAKASFNAAQGDGGGVQR